MPISTPNEVQTPSQGDLQHSSYAAYVPHDLKYSAAFEDSMMAMLLDNDDDSIANLGAGLRVLPIDSDEQVIKDVSVRAQDVAIQSLPIIPEDELPLALNDSRRIFASSVPGIKLTHPGGYIEGGPGLDPEIDTFPDDFLSKNPGLGSAAELESAIAKEVENNIDLLKQRLRARQKAKERNEQIERELKTLMDNHDMELKMQRRMAEENQKKREAKEKKRQTRTAG
ncbi:Hypothetical protein R9X50_00123000 [Acrodontium crateriforme]|uniref:Uncharacterized protein n=1 Tax=Acrodontium crateriforme TaxID=150365 RepID=A0AAQ3R7Q5_9PEZI|nr:Hypothetical protein R9X50_00123000 [Acrodontium crateriforme]